MLGAGTQDLPASAGSGVPKGVAVAVAVAVALGVAVGEGAVWRGCCRSGALDCDAFSIAA